MSYFLKRLRQRTDVLGCEESLEAFVAGFEYEGVSEKLAHPYTQYGPMIGYSVSAVDVPINSYNVNNASNLRSMQAFSLDPNWHKPQDMSITDILNGASLSRIGKCAIASRNRIEQCLKR